MVIDYKEVNKKFDCKSGFLEIKMDNDNILITTFSTPKYNYEWMVMPFGLKNAPQNFQRKMDKILFEYSNFIIVYIDDIFICFENEEDHEKHLDVFITLCKIHGIILSDKKVDIKKKEI